MLVELHVFASSRALWVVFSPVFAPHMTATASVRAGGDRVLLSHVVLCCVVWSGQVSRSFAMLLGEACRPLFACVNTVKCLFGGLCVFRKLKLPTYIEGGVFSRGYDVGKMACNVIFMEDISTKLAGCWQMDIDFLMREKKWRFANRPLLESRRHVVVTKNREVLRTCSHPVVIFVEIPCLLQADYDRHRADPSFPQGRSCVCMALPWDGYPLIWALHREPGAKRNVGAAEQQQQSQGSKIHTTQHLFSSKQNSI